MYKINKTNLSKQTKYRLSEVIGIEIFFHQNINQRKLFSKKLSKYVTAFDYIDKILTVLSAASSGVCIILSASVVGAPVGIESVTFTLIVSLTTRIIKALLSITKVTKRKSMIRFLFLLKVRLIASKLYYLKH